MSVLRRPNIAELLSQVLPVAQRHIPERIRDIAAQLDVRAALVGGVPRDSVRVYFKQLPREQYAASVRDYDVVVEGDAVGFAYELVRRLPGKLSVSREFGTASIAQPDDITIDLVSARTEHYPTPGYLPVVETGATLEADLARRDFTFNCLAVSLGDDYGTLLDVTGGIADLRAMRLRTLHSASFFDDPTRLFRALRYTARLGYDFEPVTREQFTEAIDGGNVDCLTPERVRHELALIGAEPFWADIWQAMHFSGLLVTLHQALADVYTGWLPSDARALDNALRARGELLSEAGLQPWIVRTAWALGGVPTDRLEPVCSRIGLFARHAHWIAQAREVLRAAAANTLSRQPPSMASTLLERYTRQAVVIAMFTFQPRTDEDVELRRALLRWVDEHSRVRATLSGDDLIALGLPPGPALGELRARLRNLRMDGIIRTVDEEREYARGFIEGRPAIDDAAEPEQGQ